MSLCKSRRVRTKCLPPTACEANPGNAFSPTRSLQDCCDTDLKEQQFRFRSNLLRPKVLAKTHCSLILLDEVEAVFLDSVVPLLGRTKSSERDKA
jgi:hypothetical protein